MINAHDSTVDLAEATRWVARVVGEDDPRVERLQGMRPDDYGTAGDRF